MFFILQIQTLELYTIYLLLQKTAVYLASKQNSNKLIIDMNITCNLETVTHRFYKGLPLCSIECDALAARLLFACILVCVKLPNVNYWLALKYTDCDLFHFTYTKCIVIKLSYDTVHFVAVSYLVRKFVLLIDWRSL